MGFLKTILTFNWRGFEMLDLLFIGAIIGFFLLALAYLAGCENLRKGAKNE